MRATVFIIVLSIVLLSTVSLAGDSFRLAERIHLSGRAQSNDPLSMGAKTDVPGMINYQGTLTDDGGVALDTAVAMTFSIYTDSVGGTQVWTETQPAIKVISGLFNVLLGCVNAISDTVFNDPERWLGIQVGGDPELELRQRIAAVGYAFRAAEADTAEYARSAPAVSDGDWTVSDNILHPVGEYGLSMRSSNVMHGQHDSTHVNFGIACTTGTSGQDYEYCTVGGGWSNTASGDRATVGGGWSNTAGSWSVTVGGGNYNIASDPYATVGGGYSNTASHLWATVGGGYGNTAKGYISTVSGGYYDTVNAVYGGVAAGYSNLAGDETADTSAFVGGGYDNSAIARYATVDGGQSNTASDRHAAVGGGYNNTASGYASTVGGGSENTASGDWATISGGLDNTTSGYRYATVGGGWFNNASCWSATVGGGSNNTANAIYGGVAAGYSNIAGDESEDSCAFVGGGYGNSAIAKYATVGGGYNCNSYGAYSFTVGSCSEVPPSYSNSAAFNGQSATASGQTRVGNISKTSGAFTIDHPIEPMNKILNHYFVESPEMVLIYRGVTVISPDGRAEVHLPDYFDALSRNPMVQLTGVGTSDVYVSEKVTGNRFVIGGKPNTEVYWTVTGDRKDQSAEITRILMPVEQLKEGALAGHFLDDDYLASTMSQLQRMGLAGKFRYRTQAGREKYERSRQALEQASQMEQGKRD